MNLKKTPKNGECHVMRCKAMTPNRLCDTHQKAWEEAGKPELSSAATTAIVATDTSGVSEERKAQLTMEREKLTSALAFVSGFPLETDEQIATGQAIANQAHATAKNLEKELASAIDPLKAVQKRIKGWFQPNIDCAKAIKDAMTRRIGEAVHQREKARQLALALIQESPGEAPAAAYQAAHAEVSAPQASRGLVESINVQVTSFDLLPDEFKIQVVNVPKLEAYAKANPDAEIPGVHIARSYRTVVGA